MKEDGVLKTPRLRELRERATLSQNEFSDRSGVSRATIADLEAGNRSAQARTVRRLADALGVEPEELYGEPASPLISAPPQAEYTTVVGQAEDSDDRLVMRQEYSRAFSGANEKLRNDLASLAPTDPQNTNLLYALFTLASMTSMKALELTKSEPFLQEVEGETVAERRALRGFLEAADSLSETADEIAGVIETKGTRDSGILYVLEDARRSSMAS
jgi:transcriptional regulator with XRE-family HTH domain